MSEEKISESEKKKNYVRAAYAPDGPGASSMIELLEQNGIDAYKRGGVKDIYKVGGDIFGEEIMVAPEDLQKARELLQQSPAAPPASSRPVSVKRTVLSLLAAFVLLIVLILLRGKLMP